MKLAFVAIIVVFIGGVYGLVVWIGIAIFLTFLEKRKISCECE